jgi:RNA polymerase sigma factor (sigma-70 family)
MNHSELTSTSFIDGLKSDRKEAWRRFSRIHAPVVLAMCQNNIGDDRMVRMVFDDILERIHNRIGDFERTPGRRFRNYVRKIAWSRLNDFHRKQHRTKAKLDKNVFDEKYSELEVRRVINELRQTRRIADKSWQAFLLYYEKECSIDEIARRLVLKPDSVTRTIRRIVAAVSDELDSDNLNSDVVED